VYTLPFLVRMSRIIGPSFPPHLRREEDDDDDEGPRLPSTGCLGPSPEDESSSSEDEYGPSLPPAMKANGLASSTTTVAQSEEDSEDEITIGPRLQEKTEGISHDAALEVEMRAKKMKDKLEGKDSVEVKRETWMLELPEDKANKFGLGARQFSRKGVSEKVKDRSEWTDSPEEKARKLAMGIVGVEEEEEKVDFDMVVSKQRDETMKKVAEELQKKRGNESLMDIHDKKLKKKKKEDVDEGIVKERRPFDRDLDLQANQFDAAAKKAMLKKAAKINDRFSAGVQKFL